MRVLIVDDEAPARDLLRLLCADLDLVVVGEAGDGLAALRQVEALTPDLVLLDVAMPGLDGMEVARRLAERAVGPWIVFTTAYSRYAAAAFDVAAVDYLLKPVTPARLRQAVERVRTRPARRQGTSGCRTCPTSFALTWPTSRVDAERDYVRLTLGGRTHLLRATMDDFAARLPETTFLRLHRSTLVRRDQVDALRHEGAGVWSAVLRDGSLVRIGRSHLASARAILSSDGPSKVTD